MQDDFAIIIGLQNYPGLDDAANGQAPLTGCENDAKNFRQWVASPEGGDVPAENIKMILSSDYPLAQDFLEAKPALIEVKNVFERLRRISIDNEKKGLDPKIGRRLYIFMSGHGIAPTPFNNRSEREAGLLMSNVDLGNIADIQSHIPGCYIANWYCENECFDEVFLFMDCCRDIIIVASPNPIFNPQGNANKAKRFYAFATKWSRRAKEKLIDGEMQGIFTKTLLLGLRGAAADPDPNDPSNGIITGASLKSYLHQNMQTFIDPQFTNEVVGLGPDIDCVPNDNGGKDIIIKTVSLQKFPVIINLVAGTTGKIQIFNAATMSLATEIQIVQSPVVLSVNLIRGSFLVFGVVNGSLVSKTLEVKGIEESGKEVLFTL